MIGLLVVVLFIGSIIYCVSIADRDLLRLVVYAGIALLVALAIFPLVAWGVIKVVTRRRSSRTKSRQDDKA